MVIGKSTVDLSLHISVFPHRGELVCTNANEYLGRVVSLLLLSSSSCFSGRGDSYDILEFDLMDAVVRTVPRVLGVHRTLLCLVGSIPEAAPECHPVLLLMAIVKPDYS